MYQRGTLYISEDDNMFLGDGIAVNSIRFYRIHINGIIASALWTPLKLTEDCILAVARIVFI